MKKDKELKSQIQELDNKIIQKQAEAKKTQNDIRLLVEEKNKLRKKLNNLSNKVFLSDHCIIRYLERIHNFSFDDVKKEILEIKGLKSAILSGAKEFRYDGKVFIIEDGKIITIY